MSTLLVVQEGLGKVLIVPDADACRGVAIAVGDKPHEIDVTPDGRTAFVSNFGLLEANYKIGTPGTTISVIDIERRVERTRFALPDGYTAPHGLKLRLPHGRELFTNTEQGTGAMVVLDATSGNVLRSFALPSGVHNFLFDAGGAQLFAFTLKGEVLRIDPETGYVEARMMTGFPRGLAWTADRQSLIASGRGELVFLRPTDLSIERRVTLPNVGQVFYPLAVRNTILAPAVLDGVLLAIDAATGEVMRRIETGSPLLLIADPNGRDAWVSNVLVPAAMLGPTGIGRGGGVVRLDLDIFAITRVSGTPDANGLAVV